MTGFLCQYCSGTGYEDYPSTRIPCRIPGHAEAHAREIDSINAYMKANPIPYPDGEKCPYCGAKSPCRHWDGRGWTRDR